MEHDDIREVWIWTPTDCELWKYDGERMVRASEMEEEEEDPLWRTDEEEEEEEEEEAPRRPGVTYISKLETGWWNMTNDIDPVWSHDARR